VEQYGSFEVPKGDDKQYPTERMRHAMSQIVGAWIDVMFRWFVSIFDNNNFGQCDRSARAAMAVAVVEELEDRSFQTSKGYRRDETA
jgi:hypothetical protein